MKAQTFDDYLFQGIQKLDFDGNIELNWDKEAHVFELNFTIQVENSQHTALEWETGDSTEPLNDSDVVNYDDGVLFYDQTRINGQDYADDYLTILPFDGKKGISKAILNAFLANLQDVLNDGESDLMDFLDKDNTEAVFVLKWDQPRFERYLAAQPEPNNSLLPYPKY
ncbi:MAG: DUF3013 family protein [Lactobacillus sp.]|jgi:hypothetical protein|nr:DUF3013 family protein [Lactobacillus sp.]